MSIAQEIQQLEELRRTGALSDDEFHQAKQQVLNGDARATVPTNKNAPTQFYGFEEQTWCMMIHLSQLLIFAGGLGLIVPIVMWASTKDQSELVSQHGNRMMNWLLSSLIYGLISGILCIFLIGIPMLLALIVMDIVFPILAGLKANNGRLWSYPFVIQFFPEDDPLAMSQDSWN